MKYWAGATHNPAECAPDSANINLAGPNGWGRRQHSRPLLCAPARQTLAIGADQGTARDAGGGWSGRQRALGDCAPPPPARATPSTQQTRPPPCPATYYSFLIPALCLQRLPVPCAPLCCWGLPPPGCPPERPLPKCAIPNPPRPAPGPWCWPRRSPKPVRPCSGKYAVPSTCCPSS